MGRYIKGNSGEVIDINIRDYSGAKLGTFVSNLDDEKNNTQIIYILIKKFNLKIDIKRLIDGIEKLKSNELLDVDSEFLKF